MDGSSALTLALAALSCILVILLVLQYRQYRKDQRPDTEAEQNARRVLQQHWLTSAVEGTIQTVASQVSQTLRDRFDCGQILFMRKQRGSLEVNYSSGMSNLNRRLFRFRYSDDLLDAIHAAYHPRKLEELSSVLPESVLDRLQERDLHWFFPVFWKQNLYGLYFVTASRSFADPEVSTQIAGLVYGLSAAYHVKWHESRNERMSDRLKQKQDKQTRQASLESRSNNGLELLGLLRYRNPESLFPRLLQTVRQELHLRRIACIHRPRTDDAALTILVTGASGKVMEPDQHAFDVLSEIIPGDRVVELKSTKTDDARVSDWLKAAVEAGFDAASCVSLDSDRTCLLLFEGGMPIERQQYWSEQLSSTVTELLANAESYERVEAMSNTDGLTGLANKRYLMKRLEEELGRARRYTRSLGLIMFDMDQLKTINDNYGHQAGDEVLQKLGRVLQNNIRAIDIVARFGGDEFCVVMPEADTETCRKFMARLKDQIASSEYALSSSKLTLTCTICQGAAVFPEHADTADQLIFAADMALLRAKEFGKNTQLVYAEDMGVFAEE